MSSFAHTDDQGEQLLAFEELDSPDALVFGVPRSFEDDVADRDTHAVLDINGVRQLYEFLGRWLARATKP